MENRKNGKQIQGAIFDMDGTLLDSMHVWRTLANRFLETKGIEGEPGLTDKIWTMTMSEAATYLKTEYGISGEPDQIVKEIYLLIEKFYRYEVEERQGVRRVLEELWQAGIPMCVASATDTYLVEYALERTGLRKYFQRIFCCREVGEGKESDRIYRVARESLGTPVEETWVFEDALHAARTAKNAGFPVVGIRDMSEPGQEELRRVADIYLEEYAQWDCGGPGETEKGEQ